MTASDLYLSAVSTTSDSSSANEDFVTNALHETEKVAYDEDEPSIQDKIFSRDRHGDDDSDVDEDEDDDFDMDGISMPRLSSSTIPIIVEVSSNAHKSAGFYSNPDDPLFQGVCLFSTSDSSNTTTDNTDATSSCSDIKDKTSHPCKPVETFQPSMDVAVDDESLFLWDVWFLPPVFRYLWVPSRFREKRNQAQSMRPSWE
jgi:hypothetical protein